MTKPIALTAALLAGASALAMSSGAWAAPDDFADLAEKVRGSVVNIATIHRMTTDERPSDEGRPDPREARALGSGFIIDAAGYIVTNDHVIGDADVVSVTLDDGTEYPATVVGTDPSTDIAVLKVEAGRPLPALTWGESGDLRVGEWVLAVGNPFGLGGTVTAGILSARGRDIGSGPLDDYLQIDASINQGNSGGPTFDRDGTVIGVNTAIYSPSGGSVGIGFAVPSDLAKDVVADLIEDGVVERGWFGVQIQDVSPDIAESLGMESARGALVSAVLPDSPAASSGIQTGDVIVTFDGQPIESLRDLPRLVALTPTGKDVEVVVLRDGDEQTINAVIAVRDFTEAAANVPDDEPAATDTLGLALAPTTDQSRRRFGLADDVDGVVVVDVDPDGAAAAAGIQPGDVITRAAAMAVDEPADVVKAVDDAVADERDFVLFLVERDGSARFLALPVGKA